ncbi:LD-carboxypeptidase [Synechococcus sp. RSCCF101]|uniref:S66 peptidase family protein n=1 Tax=Synechococcus sp. RSCCF101 TaxID=2511069 RepID=UPI0012493B80|nr:LD-carboxypeptidase [Synechococcus sp. RSCCF101]QEY33258.1 LD-carboxypeptidase [Synechococcus sp. RSCCF101]
MPSARPSWPPALKPGDPAQLVAASSELEQFERLEAGLEILRGWGLQPCGMERARRRWRGLAGEDPQRRADLEAGGPMPLRVGVRGGWGAARLLEHPPHWQEGWLLGFSDVTSLLWARQAHGLAGNLHGPLLTTLAAEPDWSRERLRSLLFSGEPAALDPLEGEAWAGGSAEGPLLAANLTVATHLLGTTWLPPLQGAILVLEDVGEQPYRLDRLLSHWRLNGALSGLAGLGFGSFSDCGEPDAVAAVLRERSCNLGLPVVAGLAVGHQPGNAVLPLGALARLDGGSGRLSLLE